MIEENKDRLLQAENLLKEVIEVMEVTSTLLQRLQDMHLKLNGVLKRHFEA